MKKKCQFANFPIPRDGSVTVTTAVPAQMNKAKHCTTVRCLSVTSALLKVSFVVLAILFRELRCKDCVHIVCCASARRSISQRPEYRIHRYGQYNFKHRRSSKRNPKTSSIEASLHSAQNHTESPYAY